MPMPKPALPVDICVVGQGYIGLPTAALFASCGKRVVGYDINARAVRTINAGKIHIEEPALEDMVRKAVRAGTLRASTQPVAANYFLITVPTPVDKKSHIPDMSYVADAAAAIAPLLQKGNLVILESTSPVGSTHALSKQLAALRKDLKMGIDILIAYCPERVLPGRILHELVHNDRIIGGINARSTNAAKSLYRAVVKGAVMATDAVTAEMVKLTENAYRDVNIAFANELSIVCERLDCNVWDVIALANHHPRVNILQPGPGVGGHCIAVDPWFIIHAAPKHTPLMRAARQVNDSKPDIVVRQISRAAKKLNKKRPTILCLGLSFKPDVDDLRESPAIAVVEKLAKKKLGRLMAIEPHIDQLPALLKPYRSISFSATLKQDMLADADIVVVLVKHRHFDPHALKEQLGERPIIDACGLFADCVK
jgi:UDP-N-acetyl-D-mannosaminuronic acid dehydrogenase